VLGGNPLFIMIFVKFGRGGFCVSPISWAGFHFHARRLWARTLRKSWANRVYLHLNSLVVTLWTLPLPQTAKAFSDISLNGFDSPEVSGATDC
jgi:hypothetical protein